MVGLRLGPLLRYVDEDTATVWIETDGPCEAEVRCDIGDAGGTARTWQVAGHHYALIVVVGLEPGTETPYRLLLDGREVWPLRNSAFPLSTIRTPAPDATDLDVAFGSCRWAARPANSSHDPVGPDALDALAQRAAAGGPRPDVLLLLGDQVYADETSARVRERLAGRRDLSEPPWTQVADFEEYTGLYDESWLDPEVRWLLSTVPSCMVFDDHDVIDDWNTSDSWRREMRATGWWRERLLGGLVSYWVYQHLGNLSPGELAEDPLYAAVRSAEDGAHVLREFAVRAEADPSTVRWSYRRDFGRVRLLMVDSRAGRVLDEDEPEAADGDARGGERGRAMVDDAEMAWLREQALAGRGDGGSGRGGGADGGRTEADRPCDHLLIGTSLPWLMPPAIHDAEAWDAALCRGVRGRRWAALGERMRRAADLEHWAAFPRSFRALTELVEEAAQGPEAPATVCVLSGDVHHAYTSEPRFPQQTAARVLQLTCSPMHNSVPAVMRAGFRFGWSRAGRWLGRALARHGKVARPQVSWERTGGPWFGNQLMTLMLRGRAADLLLEQARRATAGGRGAGADAGTGGGTGRPGGAEGPHGAEGPYGTESTAGASGGGGATRPVPAMEASRLECVLHESLSAAPGPSSPPAPRRPASGPAPSAPPPQAGGASTPARREEDGRHTKA
jgi:hypothetical protein